MRRFFWVLAPVLPMALGCNSIAGLSDLEEVDCVANCGEGGGGGVGGQGGAGQGGAAGTAGASGSAGLGGASGAGAGGTAGASGSAGTTGVSAECQGCFTSNCGAQQTACVQDPACKACLQGDPTTAACKANTNLAAVVACGCASASVCATGVCTNDCAVLTGAAGAGGSAGASGSAGVGGDSGAGGSAGDAGSGGSAGAAGSSSCTPLTCDQLGRNCGDVSDGCGNTISCGTCDAKPGLGCGAIAARPGLCGCAPNSFLCVGDELRQCSDNGTATVLVSACPAGTCNAGAGKCLAPTDPPTPACTTGTDFCDGKQLRACTDGVSGAPKGAACTSAQVCDPKPTSGGCDTCVEGGYFCLGTELRRCNETGKGFQKVAVCDSEQLCQRGTFLGKCYQPLCQLGETRCSGQFRQQCADTQDGFVQIEDCATAALCTKDACTPPVCAPNEGKCDGTLKQVCNKDRTGFESTPCAQPNPVCELLGGTPSCTSRGPGMVPITSGSTPYYIDSTEVTAGQYQQFLDANVPTQDKPESNAPAYCSWNAKYWEGLQPPSSLGASKPIVQVDWCDAYAYCAWAGKRLCGKVGGGGMLLNEALTPANSQWMNACTTGGSLAYPYGGSYVGSACDGADAAINAAVDVGSLGSCVTSDGVYDLSGNVSEWEDACGSQSGKSDICRGRGGAYNTAMSGLACIGPFTASRETRSTTVGFRCCAD